jgi:hypothetical protein
MQDGNATLGAIVMAFASGDAARISSSTPNC